MKITKISKFVAPIVALVFVLTQVIPAGLAEGSANAPVSGVDSQQTAVKSLEAVNAATTKVQTPPAPTTNTTDFQMSGLVLSTPAVPAPTNVTVTTPTTDGYVKLAGKKNANTTIWFSLDSGVHYTQLSASASSTSFSQNIALPVGSTTISVISKTTEGNESNPIVLTPITYAVQAPTDITVTGPSVLEGSVFLQGTKAASTSVWYSIDGGATYNSLAGLSSGTSWTGSKITLPLGSTTILLQARTYATVAGVPNTLRASETIDLDPITFVIPQPAVTGQSAVTPDGFVTLSGTREARTKIWYSLNGSAYTELVAYDATSTVWSKTIALPVGSTTVSLVTKTSTGLLSEPVILHPMDYAVQVPAEISQIAPVCEGANGAEKGYVAVKGTRAANTSIWYSLDGAAYKEFVKSGPETSWTGWIPVPVGTTDVSIQARTFATVAGVANTLRASAEIDLGTVTYAIPKLAPLNQSKIKVSAGGGVNGTFNVTISGERALNKNIAIYYSLDGGKNYKPLAAAGNDLTWSGTISYNVPANFERVLIRASNAEGVSRQVIAFAPGTVERLVSLRKIFSPYTLLSPYTLTATPNATEKMPDTWGKYRYSVRLAETDSTPGKLNFLDLYHADFQNYPYVESSIGFNATLPSTKTTWVNPTLLLGGLAQLLTADQIDPELVNVAGMNMNGLKLLPKVLVQSVENDPTVIHLTVSGTHYRIFYDENGLPTISNDPSHTIPAPTNITLKTGPSASGAVVLTGTRTANTEIWYSVDDGITFKSLAVSSTSTTWTGISFFVPVGSTTVLVQSRKTTVVSGVSTVLSSDPVRVGPIHYAAPVVTTPTNVTIKTGPSASGAVVLKGTRAANTSIWYSVDGGVTYKSLAASSSTTSWTGTSFFVPVGSTTVLVQARMTAVVSGVSTVLSSVPVSVGPIAYAAPVVTAPTNVTVKTGPSASGAVVLTGTRAANTSLWYSVDGGLTYKSLVASSSTTSWTGTSFFVPVGSTTVLVQARLTAVISGVSTVLSSVPVSVGPINYAAPVVTAPTNVTVKTLTSTGYLTLQGTRAANTSLWYSLDGGVTYRSLAASSSTTSWTGTSFFVPVGSTTVLVQARMTAVISGVSTVLSSVPVSVGPITR